MDVGGTRAASGAASGVEAAIRGAAQATGVDFGFLMRTAHRESGLNPRARALTSSAAGLFQFIDQTWLSALKRFGARHGLSAYADLIEQDAQGRFRPQSPAARDAVMALRLDPKTASLMAGELAADHAAYLRGRTGREPTAGELYVAHFLGPSGSARLIEAASTTPDVPAAKLFPEAAAANRAIFSRDGRPATVAEVYARLTRNEGAPAAAPRDAPAAAEAISEQQASLAARLDRLRRDAGLLALMNGEGGSGSLVAAQLLGAFAPEGDA